MAIENKIECATDRCSPFTSFIRDRTNANGGKMPVIIVDYLNVIIEEMFGCRNAAELCYVLNRDHRNHLIIIVTKLTVRNRNTDPDQLTALSILYPNIMHVVCSRSAKPFAKKQPGAVDYLLEADDHMIAMLTLSMSVSGCSPEVISLDQYRNSPEVFNGITSYKYTTYRNGAREVWEMRNKFQKLWIITQSNELAELTLKCKYKSTGRCLNCAERENVVCTFCGVCEVCNSYLADSFRLSDGALEQKRNNAVAAESKDVAEDDGNVIQNKR